MSDFLPDDKSFAELMKKSYLQMPFSDFEDKVLQRIEEREKAKASILRNIRLAFVFIVAGTGFGIVASLLLPQLFGYYIGTPSEGITLAFQALVVLIAVTQLDKLMRLLRKQRRM
jgi:hypothetical protein